MESAISAPNRTIHEARGNWEDGRWRVLLCHHPHGHLILSLRALIATLDMGAGRDAHNFPKTHAKTQEIPQSQKHHPVAYHSGSPSDPALCSAERERRVISLS